MIFLDFETRSAAGYIIDVDAGKARNDGGLSAVGVKAYASHPSTSVISLAYAMGDGAPVRLWLPGMPPPSELIQAAKSGAPFSAWNAAFEYETWAEVLGWPGLSVEQVYCTMARSRAYSMPGSLGTAASVMGGQQKDKDGTRLIKLLSVPQSQTKKRALGFIMPADAPGEYGRMYAYNIGDVEAERDLSHKLPHLNAAERAAYEVDQRINRRGVQVDTQALASALDILNQAEDEYTAELRTVTGGAVTSVGEVAKFRAWLAGHNVELPDMQKDTVATAAAELPPGPARRALEIRKVLGSANVKKLRMLDKQVVNGRLHHQYVYCGAPMTARWSAGGVQLQNLTSRGPAAASCNACGQYYGVQFNGADCPRCGSDDTKPCSSWGAEQAEQAIRDINTRRLDVVQDVWGDPVDALCGILRGLFVAKPGHKLISCDFSAIEAVVAAVLSRCAWRIDVFNDADACIYTSSASKITGTPIEEYRAYKAQHGEHHPDRKKIGKIVELALGYGGWINAMKAFGGDAYFNDAELKELILKWRADSPEIVHMWGGDYVWCGPGKWDYRHELHGLEGCAKLAVMDPGAPYPYNDITYCYDPGADVLRCVLPSGRCLHYHRPRVDAAVDKLNRGPATSLSFEYYNTNAAKGRVGWIRSETFGGRLFENVGQATARDLQAEALVRLAARGYPVVMHTHDEATCETPDDPAYNVANMTAIMTERPSWASWWPIRGAGWEGYRYRKD